MAKVAIITSKQPRTKAETTSRQAVAISKNNSVRTKRTKEMGRRERPVSTLLLK